MPTRSSRWSDAAGSERVDLVARPASLSSQADYHLYTAGLQNVLEVAALG